MGELGHLWLELGGVVNYPQPNTNPRLPGDDNPFLTPSPEGGYAQGIFWLEEEYPWDCNGPCPVGEVLVWFNDSYGPGGIQGGLYAGQTNWKYAWAVRDGDVLLNQPPSVTLETHSGAEGAAIPLSGVAADPDAGDALTYGWSYTAGAGVDAGASCSFSNADTNAPTITCTDDGTYTLSFTASDGQASAAASNSLTVSNAAPVVTFGAPAEGALFAVNTTVSADVLLADAGSNDTHTCVLDWGDGSTGYNGACNQVNDLYGQAHTYLTAGVYTVAATVTDDDSDTGYAELLVVVYDPSAGFVTGGGWIASPAGAYRPDETLTGKAHFGFVSRYKKGATIPEGDSQFVFEAGGLSFISTEYDWLVVTGIGSSKAQFKGAGTINGAGDYGFLLYATDADRTADLTDKDTFRIKIWHRGSDDVVYDNGVEQPLGGGSIVIHTGNAKK
jgi:PKD repeat protein